jgi:hypothetical protein
LLALKRDLEKYNNLKKRELDEAQITIRKEKVKLVTLEGEVGGSLKD